MTRTLFTAVLAALSLTACGPDFVTDDPEALKGSRTSTGGKGSKTSTATSSYAVKTTDLRSTEADPTWKSSYLIADTWTVEIASELPASITGHHVASVYVFSPSNSMYQRFDVPFAAGVAAGIDEQQAEVTATGFRVWVSLPVRGTFIDSYGMTGTWRAETWLDSASAASASATFGLW